MYPARSQAIPSAPLRRSRISRHAPSLRSDASGEGPSLRRNSPGTLSLRFLPLRCCPSAFFPLRCDASEQGSSLRQIRSEPRPSAFSAPLLFFSVLPLCRCAVVRQRFSRSASALPHFPVRALPALLCCSACICRALSAPLCRSAGIRQRSPRFAPTLRNRVHPSEKFGLNPVPPLSSLRCCSSASSRSATALLSVSVFPAPLRRFGTGFIPQTNSVWPLFLRLLRCAVDLSVSDVFPPARIKVFLGRR